MEDHALARLQPTVLRLVREAVVQALKRHYAEGRLSADELTARVEKADGAESRSDLHRLTSDLPASPVPSTPARLRRGRQLALPGPLLVTFGFGALALFALLGLVPAELWAPLFVLVVPLLVMALFAVLPLALPLLIFWLLVRGPAARAERRLDRF